MLMYYVASCVIVSDTQQTCAVPRTLVRACHSLGEAVPFSL